MELVKTDTVTEPAKTTTRNLTITVKIANTSDLQAVIEGIREFGEVSAVNYYEQTFTPSPNYADEVW